jgi:hypothetical protein
LPTPTDGSKILIFFFFLSSGKSLITVKAMSFLVKYAEVFCLSELENSAIKKMLSRDSLLKFSLMNFIKLSVIFNSFSLIILFISELEIFSFL